MTTINEYDRYAEDTYESVKYDILADGQKVGRAMMMVDDNEDLKAYCERIDIFEGFRNNGFGTDALRALSELYDGILVAPDNEDSQRLYERIGWESNDEQADYIDQGFGVYEI